MHGVLGSGFGIYGYLPALLRHQTGPVLLAESARERLLARRELAWTLPRISWARDASEILGRARVVAVALPPAAQEQLIAALVPGSGPAALVLEKPLARTPSAARDVLASARAGGRCVRVGYTLAQTRWFGAIAAARTLHEADAVTLDWSFMAHHFSTGADNWKRHHEAGGAVLRFYAIQVLALAETLGYTTAEFLSGDAERMRACASGGTRAPLTLSVDARNPEPCFRLSAHTGHTTVTLLDLPGPFSAESADAGMDAREGPLRGVLAGLHEPDPPHDAANARVIDFWEQLELSAGAGVWA